MTDLSFDEPTILDTIREAMADCVPPPVHQANGRYILPGAVIDGDQYYLYPGASIIMIEPIDSGTISGQDDIDHIIAHAEEIGGQG